MSSEAWAMLASDLLSLSVDVLREVAVGCLIRCSSPASESSTVITLIAPGGFVAGVEMGGRARPCVCGVWREPKDSVSEDGSPPRDKSFVLAEAAKQTTLRADGAGRRWWSGSDAVLPSVSVISSSKVWIGWVGSSLSERRRRHFFVLVRSIQFRLYSSSASSSSDS